MPEPMKHSEHIISIVSQVRRLSRQGTLQLDQESLAGLLQDLGNAFRQSLEMEEELEGLSKVHELVMCLAKTDVRFTHPEQNRAGFAVIGGTETQPKPQAKEPSQ